MLEYGVGSFVVGPLRETGGFTLSGIYTASSLLAAVMAALVVFLGRPGRAAQR